MTAAKGRIDVHHHLLPEFYKDVQRAAGIAGSAYRGFPEWSPESSLALMDAEGIGAAVVSYTSPGIWFGDLAQTRDLARRFNDYLAELVASAPTRFGAFAFLPLPDVDASLKELARIDDELKLEGVCLLTSVDDRYIGHPDFEPLYAELNRRKIVVYTHPATPACCARIMPYISINAIEGPVDTTRSMISLIFQGGAARYPDIRWIFSHSGGVTPFLLSRFQREEEAIKDKSLIPKGVIHELRKFYYDTAQGHHPGALQALLAIIPTSQVLYGTDFPFRDGAEVIEGLGRHGFSAAERQAINRDNALRLFPHLKG
jgi:aminocarboxymuconate-semialdehyde decarboxylase